MRMDGVTALVSGANRGLGRCFVDALMARGAKRVYGCARDAQSLTPLQTAYGERFVALRLDVCDDTQVKAAAAQAPDVDFVINNAGVLHTSGLMQAGGLDALHHEMDVNVYGVARMVLAFAPILKTNGGGAFLNFLSVASLQGFAPFGTYCASKAAAMSLTQSLRYELRDQNTAVFGAYAGLIDTDMIDHVKGDKAEPVAVVDAALDGVEAGTLDINTDERSVAVRELLREDFDTIQQAYWQRADEFHDAHPDKKK